MFLYLFNKLLQYKHNNNIVLCKNSDECAICFENIYNNYVPVFICNHLFHKKCIKSWLKINNNCPICRTNLSIINLSTIFAKANENDISNNLLILSKILKYIYQKSKKHVKYHSNAVFIDCCFIFFDVNGNFNVWNETNPYEFVYINIVLKNKIYFLKIPTIFCYQTIEYIDNNFCINHHRKTYKVVLSVFFSDRSTEHIEISFMYTTKGFIL